MLFAGLQSGNAGEATELKMRAYLLALRNISAETLREAVTAIIDGTAGLEHPQFVPSPPELAQICRDMEQRKTRQIERLVREEQKLLGNPAFSPMPEAKVQERIAEGFQKLSASLDPVIEEQRELLQRRSTRAA